jgi:hypothetical protein
MLILLGMKFDDSLEDLDDNVVVLICFSCLSFVGFFVFLFFIFNFLIFLEDCVF